eukprot:15089685-Alexandrium_andersonii.AAC.1
MQMSRVWGWEFYSKVQLAQNMGGSRLKSASARCPQASRTREILSLKPASSCASCAAGSPKVLGRHGRSPTWAPP